ncbi:MAG: uL30 family ribosomal protein [Candidatus Micrarchaeia archaeon]
MAKKDLENKLLAVIRVRGRVNVRHSISETLKRLNLNRVNNLVLVHATKSSLGMINKCNDYVTYGEASKEVVGKLLQKKGIEVDEDKINDLFTGKKSAKELSIGMPIGMKPPKHGYEHIKKSFSTSGSLGYRGEKINDLIKRMM